MGIAVAAAIGFATAAVAAAAPEGPLAARVRQAVSAFVAERAADANARVAVPALGAFDLVDQPSEAVAIELSTRLRGNLAGTVPVTVVLRRQADGRELKRGVVSARLRVDVEVLVASQRLGRGTPLANAPFRIESREASTHGSSLLPGNVDRSRLRLRRSIRAGQALRVTDVESVPVVERGQDVTLVYRRGRLQIRSTGQAREAGSVGERIRVFNPHSRRELRGFIDAAGVVHVGS